MGKKPKKPCPARKKRERRGGRRAGAGRPKQKRFLEEFAQVGPPPTDPLYATEWGMKLLLVSLDKVRTDAAMTESTRRTEMKSLIRHMKDLVPAARIAAAERIILAEQQRRTAPATPVTGSEELDDASPIGPPPIAAGTRAG